jgi:hypothetical protein
MKFKNFLRRIWHDVFYLLTPGFGVKFALRCKDVTEMIDLGLLPSQSHNRLRYRLHLSLCQACDNYFKITRVLNRAAIEMVSKSYSGTDYEKLNRKLLEKYGQAK